MELRKPKTCSCGRTHTSAIDPVIPGDGSVFFNCLCGSTLYQPTLHMERLLGVVVAVREMKLEGSKTAAVAMAMEKAGLDPRAYREIYEDAVLHFDLIDRRVRSDGSIGA